MGSTLRIAVPSAMPDPQHSQEEGEGDVMGRLRTAALAVPHSQGLAINFADNSCEILSPVLSCVSLNYKVSCRIPSS